MIKKIILSLFILITTQHLQAQTYTPTAGNLEAREEFQDMKFGMFIHWGAFSVLSSSEWVMNNKNINVADYSRLIHFFNPQNYDPQKWVATAKAAGMKYITFITRHHDGFSNWDTKQSDWKITNTPYGKDALKMLADECHKQDIKLFCYYSLLDWTRSDYQWQTGKSGQGTGRIGKSDWDSYIRFMKAQLTEILTNYGEISGIWFDGYWDQTNPVDSSGKQTTRVDWHMNEIYTLIHSLQPHCMICNNHHREPLPGEDYQAFEQDVPGQNLKGFSTAAVSKLPLETCETMNGSWGYNMTDRHYKTSKTLIQYLIKTAGNNANFLLNVGPMPDGTIQSEFTDTLKKIGEWMNENGETIYGTRGGIVPAKSWGVITFKNKTAFVHIINQPESSGLIFIPELKQKIEKAFLFDGRKEVKFKQQAEGSFIYLDGITLDDIDTIIQLVLK